MNELDSDSSVHGIERETSKSTDKKTPSDNEGIWRRSLIVETVEPDMAEGSVLHMVKHVAIIKDQVPTRKTALE